jgi:hypothetical protein
MIDTGWRDNASVPQAIVAGAHGETDGLDLHRRPGTPIETAHAIVETCRIFLHARLAIKISFS